MALLTKPGLTQLKIEDSGQLITTQVNKINFSGSVSASVGDFNDVVITVGVPATASWAISASQAVSSSYALSASNALSSSYALSASNSFTSSFALTASFAANAASFPYTGSAQITGSLGVTGSFSQSGSSTVVLQGLINQTTPQSHVVTFNNTTGQLYITASSAFGGGGGAGTPGGANTTIQFNDAGVLSGSGNFTLVGSNAVSLTGSLLVTGSTRLIGNITGSSFTGSFTGSLFGTSSWAVSSSQAVSASRAISSSYALSASNAFSSSFAETASSALNARDILVYVKNQSGYTISKGMVVHITASGNSSDIPRIITASYENDNNSANTLGIANETITNGNEGYIMTEGILLGIDTNAYVSGQLIYLGATGSITGSAPRAPLHSVRLGQVVREQSNNGSVYVRIDNGYELGELHDVVDNTTTSSYGDLLTKSGSVWVSSRSLTGSYELTGSLISTLGFTGSFSGSLNGTSSWATSASQAVSASRAISASVALTSSWALSSSIALSSSWAVSASQAISASLAVSSSYALSSSIALTASNANSASLVYIASNPSTDVNYTLVFKNNSAALDNYHPLAADGTNGPYYNPSSNVLGGVGGITLSGSIGRFNTITGSTSITGSFTGSLLGTSSFATTASFALSTRAFPYTGSAEITGSLDVTGSIRQVYPSTNTSASQEYIDMIIGLGTVSIFNKTFAIPMSVFLEYFIIDTISGADQRAGTIMASFNNTGTPTEVFTETTTADIGNTTVITFAAISTPNFEIQATNTGFNAYQLRGTLRYY